MTTPYFTGDQIDNQEHDSTDSARRVSLATKLSGEDQTVDVIKVEQRFNYSHINASGTTNVKTTPGFIHSVNVNKAGSAGDTLTLSDNGATIAVIDVSAIGPARVYDVLTTTNVTAALTATGTAADITISYR